MADEPQVDVQHVPESPRDENTTDKSNEMEQLKQQIERLSEEKKRAEDRKDELNHELIALKEKLNAKEQELKELKEEVRTLKNKVQSLEQIENTLKKTIDDTEWNYKKEIRMYQDLNAFNKEHIADKEEENRKLNIQLNDMNQQIANLHKEIRELQQNLVNAKKNALDATVSLELQKQVEQLSQQLQSVSNSLEASERNNKFKEVRIQDLERELLEFNNLKAELEKAGKELKKNTLQITNLKNETAQYKAQREEQNSHAKETPREQSSKSISPVLLIGNVVGLFIAGAVLYFATHKYK